MEGPHSTSNYNQIPFWFMLLTTFWGALHTSLGDRSSQSSSRCSCESEGTGQNWCPWRHHLQEEGLGRDVATGHFGLSVCFFPGFSIVPFWGALIFILACFKWCCTPSWGPASCRHAILILGPNFRAFIPVWKNANVTDINQNTTHDISTASLTVL